MRSTGRFKRFRRLGKIVSGLLAMACAMPAMAAEMKPGQFVWFDEIEATQQGEVTVLVSLPSQRAYVYRGGALIGISTVSTGRRSKPTPARAYRILEKQLFHRSNLYSNAPMPYMQRLTWGGIAMHAGHLPGYPASHGCIRFPTAFAKRLFALTELGGTVIVVNTPVGHPGHAPHRTKPTTAPVAPVLTADTHGLGGSAFDIVTMRDESPPPDARTRIRSGMPPWIGAPDSLEPAHGG